MTTNQINTSRLVFMFLLSLLAIACAAPQVKQRVLMPANADVMKNTKKVAVIDFHGDRKGTFTRKVEAFFSNIRVQHKPYFAVIDPSMLDSVLAQNFTVPDDILSEADKLGEMADIGAILSLFDKIASSAPGLGKVAPRLSSNSDRSRKNRRNRHRRAPVDSSLPEIDTLSYVFRQADAAQLGQLSGADTILTGVIKWPYVKHTHYEKEVSECAKYERKSSSLTPGIKSNKCVKYVKSKVKCTKQVSDIEFVIKAVSVENNQIAFTKDYSGQSKHDYCADDKYGKLEQPLKLSEAAMDAAIKKMRHDVAPYEVTLSIQLLNKDDSQMKDNKEAKGFLDTGLAFAKKGRLDRACDDFRKADQAYDQSPAILYNLGVCAEIKNDMDGALHLYRHAEDLLSKPNKYISQAFARVNDRIEKDQRVQAQLR